MDSTTQQQAPRRRNSTYLALACANAVSQGAMTRSLRQMFEAQPIRETQPLLSRAEIKQAIQAARLRRNSVVVCPQSPEPPATEAIEAFVTAVPAVVVDAAQSTTTPTKQKAAVAPIQPSSPATSPIKPAVMMSTTWPTSPVGQKQMMSTPPTSPTTSIRCDKCSSILTTSPVSLVVDAEEQVVVEEERSKSPSKIIPTNREVVEEELPKPDTVKNARCLFESSLMEAGNGGGGFSTLQHVKSNPSSKILRSESTMTLDRAGTRSSSVAGRPPFRWPSRQDHIRRSPSPSPSPPPPVLTVQPPKCHKMSATLPSYYRSSPSLTQYRSSRHSLHSTDVESYVSEGGSDCWSSSDLESEASYSSSLRDEDGSGGLDGMRYISPDVMEKIRSYGMTLTFVNGKMVDEDDDDDEPEVIAKEAATRKVVQSIRSAGQSGPMATKKSVAPPPVAPKKAKQQHPVQLQQQQQQPRIVACLPKPAEKKSSKTVHKLRHSSGESSASSGVSSGTSNGAGSDGSEHNSPFATLKRTKSADADHTVERSPSPGPRQSGTVKAVGSSPFGCYSVVYSFSASARSPMYV